MKNKMVSLKDRILIPAGIIGILSLVVAGIIVLTPLTAVYRIESFASMQTPPEVDVYWDITGLDEVYEIRWGELEPGETKTVTVYTKNVGNVAFTGYMTTDEWTPSNAGDYITLDWDFGNSPLKVGRIRTTLLTLRIDEYITGITNFSFQIIITVTEA